jgi:hypothetical protein
VRAPAALGARDLAARSSARHSCYVYCICTDFDESFLSRIMEQFGAARLDVVRSGSLKAIIRNVASEEFSPPALRERLSDPQWVRQNVLEHDRVLRAALACGPILPLRFCTIVRDEAALRAVLERHQNRLVELLDSLEGKREWGVKLFAEPHTAPAQDAPPKDGREYLQRKERSLRRSPDSSQLAAGCAQQCHGALSAIAERSVLLAEPQTGPPLALHAAYLVREQAEEQFHHAAAELKGQQQREGLILEMSGPWPAYNFVSLDLSLPPAN